MYTFPTPAPINAFVELSAGNLTVHASDRQDTRVQIRPRRAGRAGDQRLAEQTTVDFHDNRLTVIAPKPANLLAWLGGFDAVEVFIELPTGSGLDATSGAGSLSASGILGDTRFRSGAGSVVLDRATALTVKTGSGRISAAQVIGTLSAQSGSGAVEIGSTHGEATLRSASGRISVRSAHGPLSCTTAAGRVEIGLAEADTTVRTAHGKVTIGELVRGEVSVQTAAGRVELGFRPGTAAWVDVSSQAGKIINSLRAEGPPAPGQDVVRLTARTAAGDITLRHAVHSTSVGN